MYCRKCGQQIDDNAVICIHCGTPTRMQPQKSRDNTIAIVGFILSFFISIAGLICSIIGYKRSKEDANAEFGGFALAGIIISSVILAGKLLLIIFYASLIIALIKGIMGISGVASIIFQIPFTI